MLVVDPPPVPKIQGRPQSEVHDCQWLQRLHPFGVLAGALRPPEQGCVRRSSLRQRARWLPDASQHIRPRQQALTPMHLTRPHVVSEVTGATGMAILRAMLAGERDPVKLARLRNDRGHHDEATIAKARHGQWRADHLLALAHAVALYAMYHEKSAACARQIAAPLETFAECQAREALPPVSRPRPRPRHRPQVDVRGSRPRSTGVDLTALEGIDEPTAVTIISESGLDMGRWPSVQQLTSWLGLCPPHRVSGGQG